MALQVATTILISPSFLKMSIWRNKWIPSRRLVTWLPSWSVLAQQVSESTCLIRSSSKSTEIFKIKPYYVKSGRKRKSLETVHYHCFFTPEASQRLYCILDSLILCTPSSKISCMYKWCFISVRHFHPNSVVWVFGKGIDSLVYNLKQLEWELTVKFDLNLVCSTPLNVNVIHIDQD